MIDVDPRQYGRWLLTNVAAAAAGFAVGVPVGLLAAFALTRDPDDREWESFGDTLAAGFWGVAAGLTVCLLVLGFATDRWLAPGRGGPMVLATVGATIVSAGVALLLLSSFDDGHGPEDVFVGWAIIPPVVVAQWAVVRLVSGPVAAAAVGASLAVMVLGAVIL